MNSNPASSAVRATSRSSVPSRAGPPGVLKALICRPIFTRHLRVRTCRLHAASCHPRRGYGRAPASRRIRIMSGPVLRAHTLVTEDGVPIEALHLPHASSRLAVVMAHGFTLSWQHPSVWRAASLLNRTFGVIIFDFRGHGRSGGLATL